MIKKRHIKGEKRINPMDFVEYLKKSDVSENSKVYYNSMKWTSWKVLVVKVDGMHNILKSASHCLLVKR